MVEVKEINSLDSFEVKGKGFVKTLKSEDAMNIKLGDILKIDGELFKYVGNVSCCHWRVGDRDTWDIVVKKEVTP